MVAVALAWFAVSALLIAAVVAVRGRSSAGAFVLACTAAAWLPINNGRLEGPVLVRFTVGHGLTLMDLFGYAGLLLSVVVLLRGRGPNRHGGARRAIAAVCVFSVGLAASYFVQPGR